MSDWILFPQPKRIEELSGDGPACGTPPAVRTDATLPPEAFTLDTLGDRPEIVHADARGLRYATTLLAQLEAQCERPLPRVQIEDAPDFPVRGYMLDISRDRVPTREQLERLVGQLALFRINHLQLYTEHTFAYRDHETVWADASPMTVDDVRWLDRACAQHDMELCANQNTFGHMGRWLEHPDYNARAETPDGFTTKHGITLSANCLAPTDENADFAVDLCLELLACHTSQRINIGCDETFELGRGASAAEVAKRGKSTVYLEHLGRLIARLHARGHPVLFWGDILRGHPELVSRLPRENTIALAWHYEAPQEDAQLPDSLKAILEEIGIEMSEASMRGFQAHVDSFVEAGLPYWVCPGTSTWNTLIGRLANARGNLLDAAETGRANGASGYLITDWGDNGHMQPPSVSLPPLAYGAAVSWGIDANRDADPAGFLDRFVFDDPTGTLGAALNRMGALHDATGKHAMNGSPLFTDLVPAGMLGSMGEPAADAVAQVIAALDKIRDDLSTARPSAPDGEVVVRELRQAVRLARHGAYRIARAAGFPCPTDAALREDLEAGIAEQAACWLLRSRPGGLRESLARLEKTLADYADNTGYDA